jgi:hypothetical protein
MSRRTGQDGYIELSGKWWVVRWWMDVLGQEKRRHMRARICPISGQGSLSKSARERRASEIIAASGADTVEYFSQVVKQSHGVTFREQAKWWLNHVKERRRKPIAVSTLKTWEGCIDNWLNPNIGDLPLSEINNAVLKTVIAKMSEGGLSPKTVTDNYAPLVKMVVASAVDDQGEEIYPRKWNAEFIDLPVVEKEKQNTPSFSSEVMTGLARWKKKRERTIFVLCGDPQGLGNVVILLDDGWTQSPVAKMFRCLKDRLLEIGMFEQSHVSAAPLPAMGARAAIRPIRQNRIGRMDSVMRAVA